MNIFGFSIYRNEQKKKIIKNGKPIYIEFMGASGVGKSTLYTKILKRNRDWYSPNEFIRKNQLKIEKSPIDDNSIYNQIAEQKLKQLIYQNISDVDKFRIAHWGYKTLIDDFLINRFNKDSIILSEEGLLHNFGDILVSSQLSLDNNTFKTLLENRFLIYCYSESNNIARQIKKRQEETGRLVSHHKTDSAEKLIIIIEKEIKEKEAILTFLERYNVPILKINTSEDIHQNLEKINTFIDSIKVKLD